MSRLLAVVAVFAVMGGAVACSPREPEPQPHVENNGPVGPVPAGLEKFYGQQLSWGPCADYAASSDDTSTFRDPKLECARLQVPLDYAHPEGPTASLGVLRKPAIDPDQRIGSLVTNPGGPGASGMSTAASLGSSVANSDLGNRFDLVGFDPRGIGSSQPQVHCLTDQEADAGRRDSHADPSPAGTARTEAQARDYASKCAQRSGPELLANVGTRDVVKDMDVLRSALGDPKLTYLGFSYGTRIGSEYARAFPRNVRGMVLDGAVDPAQSAADSEVAQGRGFQEAFESFSQWCAQQRDCAVGRDPGNAVAAYQAVTRPLVDRPARTGDGRDVSYEDATTGTTQALYEPSLWQSLNAGLLELKQGRGQVLMHLADSYDGRDEQGHYSNVTDAFNAVRCVDDQRTTDRGQVREADSRYRQAAPFLDDGRGASSALDKCAYWPAPVSGDPSPPKPADLPPTLVISTTGDPATPYQAGVKLARALHGALLTFEGTQHTAFLQGNSCVDETTMQYLVNGTVPSAGTRCR